VVPPPAKLRRQARPAPPRAQVIEQLGETVKHGPVLCGHDDRDQLRVDDCDGAVFKVRVGQAADWAQAGLLQLERGALTVGIGGDSRFAAAANVSVTGPDLPEMVAPIGLAVAGQLLAEGLALALGLNPDAPRGLNKVTQTDE
jgi:glutamine---fructose-6-phosphate transaminase (isomerizing)